MSALGAYRTVARVTKTQGLSGEVVVVPTDGLPFLLQEGLECSFVPPTLRGTRRARVSAVRPLAKGWGVCFEGVTTPEAAHDIVGRFCLVSHSDVLIPELEHDDAMLGLGTRLRDLTLGDIGIVEEVLETKAGFIWVAQGPFGEVLVPAVEAFIVSVDDEEDAVLLDLPEGLVELAGESG